MVEVGLTAGALGAVKVDFRTERNKILDDLTKKLSEGSGRRVTVGRNTFTLTPQVLADFKAGRRESVLVDEFMRRIGASGRTQLSRAVQSLGTQARKKTEKILTQQFVPTKAVPKKVVTTRQVSVVLPKVQTRTLSDKIIAGLVKANIVLVNAVGRRLGIQTKSTLEQEKVLRQLVDRDVIEIVRKPTGKLGLQSALIDKKVPTAIKVGIVAKELLEIIAINKVLGFVSSKLLTRFAKPIDVRVVSRVIKNTKKVSVVHGKATQIGRKGKPLVVNFIAETTHIGKGKVATIVNGNIRKGNKLIARFVQDTPSLVKTLGKKFNKASVQLGISGLKASNKKVVQKTITGGVLIPLKRTILEVGKIKLKPALGFTVLKTANGKKVVARLIELSLSELVKKGKSLGFSGTRTLTKTTFQALSPKVKTTVVKQLVKAGQAGTAKKLGASATVLVKAGLVAKVKPVVKTTARTVTRTITTTTFVGTKVSFKPAVRLNQLTRVQLRLGTKTVQRTNVGTDLMQTLKTANAKTIQKLGLDTLSKTAVTTKLGTGVSLAQTSKVSLAQLQKLTVKQLQDVATKTAVLTRVGPRTLSTISVISLGRKGLIIPLVVGKRKPKKRKRKVSKRKKRKKKRIVAKPTRRVSEAVLKRRALLKEEKEEKLKKKKKKKRKLSKKQRLRLLKLLKKARRAKRNKRKR